MKRVFKSIVILAGLIFSLDLLAKFQGEVLWFTAIGYFSVLLTRLQTQGIIWLAVAGLSLLVCWGNLTLAERLKYHAKPLDQRSLQASLDQQLHSPSLGQEAPERPESRRQTPAISLGMVLLIGTSLGGFLGVLILYYSRLIQERWQPDWTVPNISPQSIERLNPFELLQGLQPISDYPLHWGCLVLLPILVLWFPRTLLRSLAIGLPVALAMILPAHWAQILQAFHPVSFEQTDPLFNLDISFYIYQLPIWELVEFWTFGVASFCFVAVTLIYLLCDNTLSNGEFPGFSKAQQRHLQGIGSALMGVLALSNGLQRYGLVYSDDGAAYGASYADVTTKLPAYTALAWLAIAISLLLLWQALSGTYPILSRRRTRRPFDSKRDSKRHNAPKILIPPLYLILSGYVIAALISTRVLPELVQQAAVQPNELGREAPYLDRNIAYTRQSFDLNTIDVQSFNPTATLDEAAIAANDLTIRNIRLWDTRPLLETNRQLQQIRLYYRFANADIGRYSIPRDIEIDNEANSETRQVILAARELDFDSVPSRAQTWINKHLVYTHGYGFTMSPVNTATPNGLPEYFVRGIAGGEDDQGLDMPIEAANERIRQSIPIGSPRIYYGELTHNYVMTDTGVQEFDYPQGDENVYNVYDGNGGVTIGTGWRRWLYAIYLRDWRMLLTDDFRPETKLLFRRNIDRRVRSIAPFLRYDHDPYLVVADAQDRYQDEAETVTGNTLYWILDAYTTSDRYPYADPGDHPFNYIRNSVKVVIDAYNGSVQFYVADERDPIIQSYQQIFPDLFQPLTAMPPSLRQHIRYPIDLFEVQSERLLIYNMTDTQVFYNREDQWEVPTETYRDQQQTVEPYYLIMKLPGETSEEFILLHPFTPRGRPNLIAWLAGRSDGENYGRLLLYQFPKQELIYGPGQIEARINQDPLISQQLSLWNRQGSRVIQGNLLVIPLDESLLYVEPLYLEADQNAIPTLVRVIVAYESQIVMAPNLDRALDAIFEPERLPERSIIRSIEGLFPGFADDPGDIAPLP